MLGIPLIVMKKLLFLFASIAMMVACTEGGTDDGNEPTPQPQKPSITLETGSLSNFNEDGGSGTITFTASEAWSAEVINSRADSWISIHPTSGAAGEATVTVTTEPNDTPDERSATIKIKAGSAEKSIKVTQKQQDALTITASSFEVSNEGGQIEIEVKANIDFEYEIEESAKEWVTYEGTRALKTSTLTFAVAENDDVEKREAKIHITSGEFDETITIYQAGAEPTLVISQNEYMVSAAGETIAVEVASNVDVTVELPADADWISENATRGVSTNTFYFDIAASEEYEQRTAEIKFSNAEKGLSETVTIVQAQKDAIVIAEDSYSVSGQGDAIEIAVGHNVEFDIKIDVDWISQSQTRALETSTLIFNVAQNETDAERIGTITFTAKDNDEISQVITVKQEAGASKIYYTSTDGNIVKPKEGTDWGGAQIVSNTYENGQGVITFDGVVTKIGRSAFVMCQSLTNITIPESVTEIGFDAFDSCTSLQSIAIPETVTLIGEYAFFGCSSLATINIPEGVTSIGDGAFGNCSNLYNFNGKFATTDGKALIIENRLIAFAPFEMTSYTIPEGITSIGNNTFDNCGLVSINIPNSVISIGLRTFRRCHSLATINIPENVTSIEDGVFDDCRSLTSITIPKGVTSIGSAFTNCISLVSITIPEGVTSIGRAAFAGCSSLASITIPEGITSIEYNTFYNCKSLTSITIPEGVTSIGEFAFENCSSLTSVIIPESVTTIIRRAFFGCSSLTSITIPKGVTSIGDTTFSNCSSLTSVYCNPTTPPTMGDGNVFHSNASGRKIYVPSESVNAYKGAFGWRTYANFIEGYNPDAPNQSGTFPVLNKESIASKMTGEFDRGGEGVGYHDLSGRNGGTPDVNPSGGVGYTKSGEWLAYTIYVEDAGTYKFTMYGAASQTAGTYGGSYQWFLDDPNVAENALGPRFKLQNSGSWAGPGAPSESVEFELSEGYQRIIFYMHDGYHELYNFTAEWVE